MRDPRGGRPYNTPSGVDPGAGSMRPPQGEADDEFTFWQDRSRVFLQPIAAPSILGLFGLATATLMVGAWMAAWYGSVLTPLTLFPFVLTAGGLAQFLAGMWSYRARDGLATAVHGMWGTFWLAFGLLFVFVPAGAFPAVIGPRVGVADPAFGMWFVPLCIITAVCALAALAENLGMATVLTLLTLGSGFAAAGFFAGSSWPIRVAGWMFVIAAAAAIYTAAAMMLENSFRRTMLPLGRSRRAERIPVRRGTRPLEYRYGQPGVRIGQ